MDSRLLKIVEKIKVDYGLESYTLINHEVYKERDHAGYAYYTFDMEFFPAEKYISEEIEEGINPDGTAVVSYHIQKELIQSVTFVGGKSYAETIHFTEKTAEEVAAWIESETGFCYGTQFKLVGVMENGFRYETDVDGVKLSSAGSIDVEFDDLGKLTSYWLGTFMPSEEEIKKEKFTLSLEEIEPLVKKQLQLVNFPIESEKRFSPVYAMEEIYIIQSSKRTIPFSADERLEIPINKVLEWNDPLKNEKVFKEIPILTEATAEEAFNNIDVQKKLMISDDEISEYEEVVRDALRANYPTESNKWIFTKLDRAENYIEAHCHLLNDSNTLFPRKIIVFINPADKSLINMIDNKELFEDIFEDFIPAKKPIVTHEEAFEKLLSYITLDPAYVYDPKSKKYRLCGLLDAAEGIDAVTGEIVSLSDL